MPNHPTTTGNGHGASSSWTATPPARNGSSPPSPAPATSGPPDPLRCSTRLPLHRLLPRQACAARRSHR